jgi:hypothetical protein
MSAWQLNVVVNSAKALAPFQAQLRQLKRTLLPLRMGHVHDLALQGACEQVQAIRELGVAVDGARVMEIGSGWYPVAPLVFRAAGARQVYLTDMHRLLHPRTLRAAMAFVAERADRIEAALGVPADAVRAGLDAPEGLDFQGLLAWLGFTYLAPYDIARGPEIDIAYSHTVLEHISPEGLAGLFAGLRAKLAPGGVMSHGVDHTDHRSNQDPALSTIDFLRYSDAAWKLFCLNPQDYTNRLRHPDYLKLIREAGFGVAHEYRHVSPKAAADAKTLPLWGRFAQLDEIELATTWSLLITEPLPRQVTKA